MMTYPEITDEISAEVGEAVRCISLLKITLAPRTDDAAKLVELGACASLNIVIIRQPGKMRPRNEIIGDGFSFFELMVDYERIMVVEISKDQRPYCTIVTEAYAPSLLCATERGQTRHNPGVCPRTFHPRKSFMVYTPAGAWASHSAASSAPTASPLRLCASWVSVRVSISLS